MSVKFILKFLFLCLYAALCSKQQVAAQSLQINKRIKVYSVHFRGDSVVVKADNDLLVPVTLTLKTSLQNLSGEDSLRVIIPPNSCGVYLCVWKPLIADAIYKWNFSWTATLCEPSKYIDVKNVYLHPFTPSKAIKLTQKPNGKFSHKHISAFDFAMPEGTSVTAARAGMVILTKADSDIGGPDKKYSNDANYISILHADGTIASYLHFKKDGIVAKEGMPVQQGQLIGYSGNTGFSDGPHLHFELMNAFGAKSLPNFRWKKGAPELPSNHKATSKSNALLAKILSIFHIRNA